MTPPTASRRPAPNFKRRMLVFRVILSVLVLGLSIWLATAAQAPTSNLVERALLLLIAILLPVHLFLRQLGGTGLIDRARRVAKPMAAALAYLALAASPMVLYPLGAIAVLVALVSGGGAATPALGVSGLLMLSPILAILAVVLMFMAAGNRRR